MEKVDKKRKNNKKREEKYFYPNSEREGAVERQIDIEISGRLIRLSHQLPYIRVFSLHQACSSLLL